MKFRCDELYHTNLFIIIITVMMSGEPTEFEFTEYERACMSRALQLASNGLGYVEPNPMVGCVISDGKAIVAEGFHERYGEAHAEVNALAQAKQRGIDLSDKTMFVTLEPCAHHGKTPPCVDAVVAAGVRRVVVAMQDPFEAVAGRGLVKMRQAGIEVKVGLLEDEARDMNRAWLHRLKTGLPWVTLKWAQTLDGRIATRTGHSQWISGEHARQRVHRMRAISDAILVGAATARADDPMLTARDVEVRRIARKVVVDPQLRLSEKAKLLCDPSAVTMAISSQAAEQPEVAERQRRLAERGVEVLTLPVGADGTMLLRPLFEHLSEHHDAMRILVEGGGVLHGHLLRQKLANELCVFVSPKVLGDADARPALSGGAVELMDQADLLELREVERVGDDVMLRYRVGD